MKCISVLDIQKRVSEAAFGKPLITNVLRGQVVEAIIASALEPDWRWCAADYSSWDFEHNNGLRLEVKQSAAKQSWPTIGRASPPSFDIKPRTGRWEDGLWVGESGRAAQIYALCYHPILDDSADHRDPSQWHFYLIGADQLPATQRIGLHALSKLVAPVGYGELAACVGAVAELTSA